MKTTKVDKEIAKIGNGVRLVDEKNPLYYGKNEVIMICYLYFIIKVSDGFKCINTNMVSKDFNGKMFNHLRNMK